MPNDISIFRFFSFFERFLKLFCLRADARDFQEGASDSPEDAGASGFSSGRQWFFERAPAGRGTRKAEYTAPVRPLYNNFLTRARFLIRVRLYKFL
jgi:hypothetical protein